ncbi:MAG: hypothetical protein H0X64_14895 [Gemmatimonadaceae bacterium]|nr:hypothetical protein [Gemmatimonadaceae bacterium]
MPTRRSILAATLLVVAATSACRMDRRDGYGETSEQAAIADTLTRIVKHAYDFSQPDVVDRLLAIYPDTGRVVSATGGRVVTSRDSLDAGIRTFWATVGQNMQDARTEWGPILVDVPSTRAAVVTAEYTVPHRTPRGDPHVIGGAMTLVFAKRANQWVVIQEHLSDIDPVGGNTTTP